MRAVARASERLNRLLRIAQQLALCWTHAAMPRRDWCSCPSCGFRNMASLAAKGLPVDSVGPSAEDPTVMGATKRGGHLGCGLAWL